MVRTATLLLFSSLSFLTNGFTQTVNIPDSNFLNALIADGVDINDDGLIQLSEAKSVTQLLVRNANISSLEGIESFCNLQRLFCDGNELTSLDISQNQYLENLVCNNNNLSYIDVTQNLLLKSLLCGRNNLQEIDVTENLFLERLDCQNMNLLEIDISKNNLLIHLDCSSNNIAQLDLEEYLFLEDVRCDFNQLTDLNLSKSTSLRQLTCNDNILDTLTLPRSNDFFLFGCQNNQLKNLNFNYLPRLFTIDCSNNLFEQLDFSNNPLLNNLFCINNPIKHININNGTQLNGLSDIYNEQLNFLCYDDFELPVIEDLLGSNISNVLLNSYCNFSTLEDVNCYTGSIQFDEDGACDLNSPYVSQIPFSINSGMTTYKYWPLKLGEDIKMFFEDGVYDIEPYINSNLFASNPSSVELDYSIEDSLYQSFCLQAINNSISDLSIDIIPTKEARAGALARYTLIVENKGNLPSSGIIQLEVLDQFVNIEESSDTFDDNMGLINWEYQNLLPFTKKFITVVARINSPMDMPPLYGGEILKFNAEVIPVQTDQNPSNNITNICDVVVNSFDPNDIRCLQGSVLDESRIGTNLDYLVRFENIGNADAVNITIQDTLDENYFEVSTFEFVNASHPVHIVQVGPYVEFIFRDINLSYQDSINTGYVVFSIKSKGDLSLGDTIRNKASIYFDFNWPIVTNEAATVIGIDEDLDGFSSIEDCDDTNSNVNPGLSEVPYNGINDDCDSTTFDDDLDQDGFSLANDCNDNDATVNPDQDEVPYNGVDDDCDSTTFDDDLDQDGFSLADDCNDNDALVNPHQDEVPYNGIDDDCDSTTPDDDLDQDGFPLAEDCDDNNVSVNPDQSEVPYNSVDDDCDSTTPDDDLDEDGFPMAEDCNDNNASVNPDQSEVPYNGIDDDCDSTTFDDDLDQDGFSLEDDCNDQDSSIFPGAEEECDGLDNDCDVEIDEDLEFITYYFDLDQDGYGDENSATLECSHPDGLITIGGDCDDNDSTINPDAEDIVNNGIDENCDGMDSTSSTNELERLGISVFPNPVKDILYISQDNPVLLSCTFYDVKGQQVLTTQIIRTNDSIDTSSLNAGVYIARILNGDKAVHTRVVVK